MKSTDLSAILDDARRHTIALVDDLSDEQRLGPKLDIVNPLLWELGHIAWFHEKWTLRDLDGRSPARADADALYDSIAIAHDTRWELALPDYEQTRSYMQAVLDRMQARLAGRAPSEHEVYRYLYTTFHEDMHSEAFTYTRQTHGWTAPGFGDDLAIGPDERDAGPLPGDVEVPGGRYLLGGAREQPFVFDNEKWAHAVDLEPFEISRAPVTNAEFAAFVDDGGYTRRELWSEEGWSWRCQAEATHPVYWRPGEPGERGDQIWQERHFDRWETLSAHRPIVHVNFWEANAWCRWAGRRLPTEAEWEAAASATPAAGGELSEIKRRYPWGDEGDHAPTASRANLDWNAMGTVDVAALPEGDSAFGCRQMLGNVWEWTSSVFEPYPDFERDFYAEYSEPWFGDRRVLRGGSWATRSRMIRNTWRNYFTPERRDVFAGFRTCALK